MNRLERLAPFTGIVAMLLVVAEFVITGDTPNADDPAQKVVRYWQDHKSEQQIAAVLFALAAVAFVWFGASLRQALRRAEGEPGRLSSIAFAGTVVIAVGLTTYAGFGLAVTDSVGDVPPSVTQTFSVLNGDSMFVTIAAGTMLLLLSTGIAVLRHGGLPKLVGWVAIALAVVGLTPAWFVPFLALALYLPALSILIYRQQLGGAARDVRSADDRVA